MPPAIRTIVDAAGDITAIETYQGPRGWVPITVAQEGPVIQRADVADLLTVRVYHAGCGCDTGCCGHVFELTKPDGTTVERFEFDHPYTDAAGVAAWALTMAREVVADRWPECADSIDWSTIDVSEARDC